MAAAISPPSFVSFEHVRGMATTLHGALTQGESFARGFARGMREGFEENQVEGPHRMPRDKVFSILEEGINGRGIDSLRSAVSKLWISTLKVPDRDVKTAVSWYV